MENESAYILHNPAQILSKLAILIKNKRLITAYFGEKNESFVTTLFDLDRQTRSFIFDGCKDHLVEKVLSSPKVIFKTEHLGAKVVFNSTGLVKREIMGKLAFAAPIPDTLRWMEYREYYRVRTSATFPSQCQLTLEGKAPITLKLYDISLRGFSVLNNDSELSELLVPEASFEKCTLNLAGVGDNIFSFEVRNKLIINPDKINETEKIGCKFTRITASFEDFLQRYMMQLEREILQKKERGTVIY